VRLGARDAQRRGPSRAALALLSIPAVIAIAIPLATVTAVRDSQAAASRGKATKALADARTAASIEPQAATPDLQQALVFERAGQLDTAARYASRAAAREPRNWRPWLTLSRVEAERGHAAASVAAYRHARTLDRRSPIFQGR